MNKKTQFEKTIQTEISALLNIQVIFGDIQIVENEEYEEKKRISIYQMKFNSIIVTAPSLYEDINNIINSMGIHSRIYIDQLKNLLNLDDHKIENKTIYLFLNPADYKDLSLTTKYKVSRLDEESKIAFDTFQSECPREDLNEGFVSLEDPVVFGCFYKDKLIGIASYWFWGENIADIGVVVHPEYRRQGTGKVLVSKLCNWGINNKKINLYRHNEKNKKSHILALSLNFKQHFFVEGMSL